MYIYRDRDHSNNNSNKNEYSITVTEICSHQQTEIFKAIYIANNINNLCNDNNNVEYTCLIMPL